MFMQSDVEPRRPREALRERLERAADLLRETYDHAGERASEFARTATRRGRDTALATVAEVRRRPAPLGIGVLVAAAAVALWLSPKLRADIVEGAGRLLTEFQKGKGPFRF